ncbi:MAG: hypothetical protein AB1512_14415 [Thermodesulfobacteriota bacterium]
MYLEAASDWITIKPGFRVETGAVFVATQTYSEDSDGDGLPDWWEMAYFV